MAITVGSVEVDVVPNTQGIQTRLQNALVPPATVVGDEVGRIIGRQIVTHITPAIRDGINAGARAARPAATRQGNDTAGAFARALKTRLEAAFRALPKINIDANTSQADADLQALRVRMETLANQRIGIDIEASAAKAEIKLIDAELKRLGAEHPNVQVRADTATARAELAAVRAQIAAVDGKRINIDTNVSTAQALSAILQLSVAIAGLAAIPAVPVLAAGIGSIAAAGVAAGAGVGALAAVAIPAFVGIAGALQAQKAAQDAATSASIKGGQASGQGASKALQMAGAQQALASAERNGARQIAQAQQQVRQAKTAAADAIVQAAQRNAAAARAIEDAERNLAQSQKDAKRAQEDLTDARREAAQEIQDLNSQLAGAQLSQRDAQLGVKEAQLELNKVMAAGSKASELDKARAKLAYDQAVQRLKDQTTETGRLKTETASANKAGVEGSDTVRSAQERLAQAQQQVADRARAVGDAQAEAARTQVETARQVAQAQERVGEATKNVAYAQQAAADSVSSAQRQIASASQSAAGGVDQAALAQAKYQAALAKLTPEARGTFNAFLDLRGAFSGWSKSLQPQVMPLFTRAIIGLKNALPGLIPFVLAAVRGISTLQDRASQGFKNPWWKGFKKDLAGSVEPAIVGLGGAFGRIFKGMAGIIQAFLPHMDSISATMLRITGRFATWGTSLKGSEKFEGFLAYASRTGPVLAEAIGDIASALYQVSKASAPLSGPVLQALGAVARAVASIAETLPWLIQLFYAAWIATKIWTLALFIFNAVMSANPITLIIIGIIALVAAVIYAYKHSETFRRIVQAAWEGIKTAALFVWNTVLKPIFNALVIAFRAVATAATWLWRNVISPVFNAIALAAKILLTAVVVIVLLPIIAVIKILGAIAKWLWDHAIGPAFRAIGAAAMWLWRNVFSPVFTFIGAKAVWLWNNAVKPVFGLFKQGIQSLSDKAKWLWEKILRPTFTFIGDKGKWLWDHALKPAFDNIKRAIGLVADSFGKAKDAIKLAWDKVEGIAKKPVKFVIDKVYNHGIVPVWNKVASAFGAPSISEMPLKGWATGGVLPGYTPGRDPHKFYSPTGGGLELSGGEAIMRPEFTRAVGSGFVNYFNRIARSRGSNGVKAALAPALGGNPNTPTQKFSDGGIFGWIAKTTAGVGSKAWEGIKKSTGWVTDTLEASARAGVRAVVDPILRNFPGADSRFGKMIRRIPSRILNSLFGYSKTSDKKGGGGLGGPKIQAGLRWAKTQAGLPYQWAGNGNPSWDCSGFLSAIESVIRGQKPHRRWATGAFSGKTAPPGWVLNAKSPYRIGITNSGVGHTAGTIAGTNVESRGGQGVIVGKGARSWNDSLFNSHYGFMPGGTFDSGGYLPKGLSLAYNGTGRPEPVLTSQQYGVLSRAATEPGLGDLNVQVFVGNEEITDIARAEVRAANGDLVSTLRAGRKG